MTINRKTLSRYMNLLTDFAFKRIFGTEENKHLLITFLTLLFAPEIRIRDVSFKTKEVLPHHQKRRKVVYDVYCTTEEGRHIIVEMQQSRQVYFMNRALIYTAMGMIHQAKRGKWNYRTEPVYGVFLTNFSLPDNEPRLVTRAGITDLENGKLLTSAQKWFFVDLSMMERSSLEECKNDLERWIYCVKNMNKFEEVPVGYDTLRPLFEASETASLSEEDVVAYSQSEQRFYDEEVAREEYGDEREAKGRKEGLQEGRKEGLQEGRKEGQKEERLNIARKLKEAGMALKDIISFTGLSSDVVASL